MTPGSKKLIILLSSLLLCIYLKYYLAPSPILQIIQTSVSQFKSALLFDKLPIVLNEPIVNPLDLIHTVFKYLYVYKKHLTSFTKETWIKNKARYLVIYSLAPSATLGIAHPYNPQHHIQVLLEKHKCIVLPASWTYNVYANPKHFQAYELYDIISILFQPINKK